MSSRIPAGPVRDIALDATLRTAAPYQLARQSGEQRKHGRIVLIPTDLREKVRVQRIRHAICFVVDTSWSMVAQARMETVKATVMALLRDAYHRRDRLSLVCFSHDRATVLLPLTNNATLAGQRLSTIATGGRTPLSRGLFRGYEVLDRAMVRETTIRPLLVVLTDGRANVSMTRLAPQEEAYRVARLIVRRNIAAIVIDTEVAAMPGQRGGPQQLARKLAGHLRAVYVHLDELHTSTRLAGLVKSQLRVVRRPQYIREVAARHTMELVDLEMWSRPHQ